MLLTMLQDTVERVSSSQGVRFEGRIYPYAELLDQIERLAAGLAALGVGTGTAVAILLPNSPEFFVSFYSVVSLGGIAVPLDPRSTEAELLAHARRCDIRVVIADQRHLPLCRSVIEAGGAMAGVTLVHNGAGGGPTIGALMRDHGRPVWPNVAGDADALYLFSSGSTGRAKRVPLTQAQLVAYGRCCADSLGFSPEDVVVNILPPYHSMGLGNCYLASAFSGASLIIPKDPQPLVMHRRALLSILERERATIFPGVPFIFDALGKAPQQADLSAIRFCYSAGSSLQRATFDRFQDKFGIAVRQAYGSTECGLICANTGPQPQRIWQSVGRPLLDTSVEIVDSGAAGAPEHGEILVRSSSMTNGYAGMEALNQEVFRNGGFLTGDLGHLDCDGNLFLTGRVKLFIDIAGEKIDPIEVEDVLHGHPDVSEAVVVGVPDTRTGGSRLKAVLVAQHRDRAAELLGYCRTRLARHKVPELIEFRDALPRSPTGKILRGELIER